MSRKRVFLSLPSFLQEIFLYQFIFLESPRFGISSGILSSVFIFAQIRLLANIYIFKDKLQIFVVVYFHLVDLQAVLFYVGRLIIR
jgi:hypothetical protein